MRVQNPGRGRCKRLKRVLCTVLIGGVLVLPGLILWRSLLGQTEKDARVIPEYSIVDIGSVLEKTKWSGLSAAEYKLLYEQTGMSPGSVDKLVQEGQQVVLLELQKNLFAVLSVVCTPNTIITREERTESKALIPYLEEGDILVTFNCHASMWRNGHVAIVTDAEKRLVVESGQLGTKSGIVSLQHWETYPSFAVLRLKGTDLGKRMAVADYAEKELVDIPYRLEAKKSGLEYGTHCAHLTWYAYKYHGYDVDNDGGWIVTPRDIFDSEILEIVQIYGMPMPAFEEIYKEY